MRLLSVQGKDTTEKPFNETTGLLRTKVRPLVLEFENSQFKQATLFIIFAQKGRLGIGFAALTRGAGKDSQRVIVVTSLMSEHEALKVGMVLHSVQGQLVRGKQFKSIMGWIKEAPRPLAFRFEATRDKYGLVHPVIFEQQVSFSFLEWGEFGIEFCESSKDEKLSEEQSCIVVRSVQPGSQASRFLDKGMSRESPHYTNPYTSFTSPFVF